MHGKEYIVFYNPNSHFSSKLKKFFYLATKRDIKNYSFPPT